MSILLPERLRRPILRITFMAVPTATGAWTNMGAAEAFFMDSANSIQFADLSRYTECRLLVVRKGNSGAASAEIYLEYYTAYSTTVGNYVAVASSAVSVDITAANTATNTSWTPLVAGARTSAGVYLAVLGINGDGALDPQFGYVAAEFR